MHPGKSVSVLLPRPQPFLDTGSVPGEGLVLCLQSSVHSLKAQCAYRGFLLCLWLQSAICVATSMDSEKALWHLGASSFHHWACQEFHP